jgi:hypothetical protein
MVHEIQPFWLLQNPMGIPMTFFGSQESIWFIGGHWEQDKEQT